MLSISKGTVFYFIEDKHSSCTNVDNSFPYPFLFKDKKPIPRINISLLLLLGRYMLEVSNLFTFCYTYREPQPYRQSCLHTNIYLIHIFDFVRIPVTSKYLLFSYSTTSKISPSSQSLNFLLLWSGVRDETFTFTHYILLLLNPPILIMGEKATAMKA